MSHALEFYINGQWVKPHGATQIDVINPATEQPCAQIALGDAVDVERAVAAAKAAFPAWSVSTREERLAVLERMLAVYKRRSEDMAQAISLEMGSPIARARDSQSWAGLAHLEEMIAVLRGFSFEGPEGDVYITREAVGVCG